HATSKSISSAAFVKDDRAAILAQALHDVVGLHYFAFFPHEVWESLAIMDGPGSVEGNGLLKQFKLGEALQAYEKALTPGSTDAATMGNAALVAAALGDDAKAAAWAAKAVAIEPSMRNKQIKEEIELRQGTRKAF
ncbi:MAG: hypothetical protein JST92_04015, partial [Deltaproteobacteria bacterium]|nr:hypothetical protein [Deltaproteobacteria bacterium]